MEGVAARVCVCQVLKIRQMLTEVLLEVTNQEIENVVTETIEEAKSKALHWVEKGRKFVVFRSL